MLTMLALVGSHGHHGAASAGIVAAILSALSMLAVGGIFPTRFKNSGILRYFKTVTQAPQAIQCLGAGADVLTDDNDSQLFGGSPGHGAVGAFSGGAALQEQPTNILVANPTTPGFGTHTAPTAYIPAGTKVHAYFIPTDPLNPGSVFVTTQVVESRIRRGANGTGNNVADATGASFLGSIRIGLVSLPNQNVAGVLIVELQHSEHDIPGLFEQDQTPLPQ